MISGCEIWLILDVIHNVLHEIFDPVAEVAAELVHDVRLDVRPYWLDSLDKVMRFKPVLPRSPAASRGGNPRLESR